MQFFKKYKLGLALLFLISLRFFHFSETIDTPHAWRQYDTLQYIDGYHVDDNAFLAPSVCWMGDHETLVLEFPLPEYMIAGLYDLFGNHLWIARLFFLLFFALTTFFFYRVLQLVFSDNTPLLATLIFGLAPLSLFFSRAIHIDFFALAFSIGMLYYAMKAIRDRSFVLLVLSMFFGIITFLIKAPYCFFLAIPIIVYAINERQFKWILPRAIIFIIPVICLFLWNRFAHETNTKIPDWNFIPNFNNFSEMWYWYFGTVQQRLSITNWTTVFSRIHFEILGFAGILFFGFGTLFSTKGKSYVWTMSWLFGTLIYLFIFFNLNIIHNYYQLPFVAPLAICMALGINWIGKRLKAPIFIASICVLAFMGEQFFYAESNYYTTNDSFEKIASILKKNSVPEDRIVVSYGGLSPQCPLILQPAKRKGWSIPINDLSPSLVYRLSQEAGANKLAIVYGGYFEGELQHFFEAMKNKIGIPIDEYGKVLYICDLNFETTE